MNNFKIKNKKITDYKKDDIEKYGGKIEYLPNGIDYVKIDMKQSCSKIPLFCDICNATPEKGYLVWFTHSYYCEKCFKTNNLNASLNDYSKEILNLYQNDPTTYLWYLSYFDKDIQRDIKKIKKKEYEKICKKLNLKLVDLTENMY